MRSANLSFLKDLDLDYGVEDKLSRLIERVESGNSDVFTTPFGKELGIDNLFSEFNLMFSANKHKLNSVLLELEDLNKAKFGPRSIAIPWAERKQSLTDSFDLSYSDYLNKVTFSGGDGRLRPIALSNALKLLKNNTSSGLPYMTKKGLIKERVFNKFDDLLKRKDPCVLFTRTQEGKKTRNVWGYPVADTLNEMTIYSPLLEHQKRLKYRSALVSPDQVSEYVTALILEAVKRKKRIVSMDFGTYDNSVKTQAQDIAFSFIKSLFQEQASDKIDYIKERFNTIGIVTPDGVFKGEHGVPSGSTFTNEVDSIVQAIIALNTNLIDENHFQVQGDDGVYLIDDGNIDAFLDAFKSCGLKVNEDKTYVGSTYAIYLQNLYHKDYLKDGVIGGIYPIYRALNRLVYQERWSDFEDYELSGQDYYSIRAICIVENCKHHPLFKELVQFVVKHDKYSLAVTQQGIAKYVQMVSSTKGAGDILNHHYGSDPTGIESFETFKLIKAMS